jgi:hypothetical protein
VERRDLGFEVAGFVVIVREAERGAPAAKRRITGARDDGRGFVGRPHHRHHHAERADIERAGDEVIFAARDAHHRDERKPRHSANWVLSVSKPAPVCSMS